jgi:hypothetical protein
MADYQDFRARFRAQRQAVTKAQDRATQEQQIVNSQQATLWESLRKEAEQAVTQINQGGEPLLTFAGSDVGQAAGFSISSTATIKETREAKAEFMQTRHMVKVQLSGNRHREYKIVASNGNMAVFTASESNVGEIRPEKIIGDMLQDLLE